MPSTPRFKIGDIVYLRESAKLGQLEAYRVGQVSRASGFFIYTIFINPRPAQEAAMGDQIDGKRRGTQMSYGEDVLVDFCEAVDIAIAEIERKLDNLRFIQDSRCSATAGHSDFDPDLPRNPQDVTTPKFEIDETVFIGASAKIGFRESYRVTDQFRVPNSNQWAYRLNIPGINGKTYYFKETELMKECEALGFVIAALERDLTELTRKAEICD